MADKVEKRILTLYSDVQATSVHWLWYPFIAVGKITLLQGDPGDGKSTMMMNLIAELLREGQHRMESLLGCRKGLSTSVRKMEYQMQTKMSPSAAREILQNYSLNQLAHAGQTIKWRLTTIYRL